MRVLFLQDSAINESLALCDLSACLKQAGHDTLLLLEDEERDLEAAIQAWAPALCVVPCHVTGHRTALRLARRCRSASRAFVLMGGTHVTFEPDLALQPEVDAVCIGEAEGPTLELAERLSCGADWRDIPNLAFERDGQLVRNPLRPLVEDLDSLPPPDRELYFRYPFIARFPFKKFATGRGCVHACTFCWNTTLRGMYAGQRFTRRKSPERAVSEIEQVVRRHPTTNVHFSDDLFTVFPAWLDAFADLYRERVGVPFTCNSSVELVSERTCRALKRAGCRGVAIGVETGNEELRSRILAKTVTNDEVRRAAALIKGHGLELTTFNMIGSPGETLDDALSTVALNREIGADHVRCNVAVPLPHTDFEVKAQQIGQLAPDYARERVDSLERPQVAFTSDQQRAFVNLFYLFRPAVHLPLPPSALRRLVNRPTPRVLDLLRLWIPFEEKRIYHLGWSEGLRYFRHVGDPHKRTANYVTLI